MKCKGKLKSPKKDKSSPARGTWVEIGSVDKLQFRRGVVSRTGDVG